MNATTDQIAKVCNLLHSRGREATPYQVREWLEHMVVRYQQYTNRTITEADICIAVLRGQGTFTMCMHLHFGDSLESKSDAPN